MIRLTRQSDSSPVVIILAHIVAIEEDPDGCAIIAGSWTFLVRESLDEVIARWALCAREAA